MASKSNHSKTFAKSGTLPFAYLLLRSPGDIPMIWLPLGSPKDFQTIGSIAFTGTATRISSQHLHVNAETGEDANEFLTSFNWPRFGFRV